MWVTALEITGKMTAGDVAVAAGTAALAIFTAVLAHRTKQDVDAGTRSLNLERAQLEQSYRPVVMPYLVVAGKGSYGLLVTFQNIGVGPALSLDFGITLSDGSDLHDIDSRSAVGARMDIEFECLRGTNFADGLPPFSFEVRYRDVAGKTWRMKGEFGPPDKWTTGQPFVKNAGAYPTDYLEGLAWDEPPGIEPTGNEGQGRLMRRSPGRRVAKA